MESQLATNFGIIVAAVLTLCIYSFLYKDNPAYKLAESILVGVGAGYTIAVVYDATVVNDLYKPLTEAGREHDWGAIVLRVIPIIVGLMMWSRFFPKYAYLSRVPMAFAIGLGAGAMIPATIKTNVIVQAGYTMQPLVARSSEGAIDPWLSLSNVVMILGVVSVLAYFYFSKPHEGGYGRFTRLGIWFLMFAFGAKFGYTVMARIALMLDRVYFLLKDFLGVFGIHIVK